MLNAKMLREVEALEERLQTVKWNLSVAPRRSRSTASGSGIASRTAALLGKSFTPGVIYERRIRRGWHRRLRRVGL